MARATQRSAASAVLATAGALMALVGAQMPALEFQWLGAVSYLDIGGTPATLLLCSALGVLLAVALRHRGLLVLAALALWVALLWPALRLGYEELVPPERSALDALGDALGEAVGRAAGDELLRFTGLRAGAFVLLGGCLLVSLGAARRR